MSKKAKNSLCRICVATCDDRYKLGKQAVHKYCYMFRKSELDPSPNYPHRTPEGALRGKTNLNNKKMFGI